VSSFPKSKHSGYPLGVLRKVLDVLVGFPAGRRSFFLPGL
jgi:hypothetical protein